MNQSQYLRFGTEKLELTPTVFESMINNMGSRLRKMKLKLDFVSEENKVEFMKALTRLEQEGEDAQLQSSEEEEKEEKIPEPEVISAPLKAQESLVIDEPFEVSILLRERFMDQLLDIGHRLNVTFMVIPNKVKIIGRSIQKVGDAQDEYREIKDNICLENIEKYGKQVYQSRYFKQVLLSEKVEIMQILRKYYVWFERHKTDPTDVLKEVFQTTHHRTYPLLIQRPSNQLIREPLDVGKAEVVHGSVDFYKCQEKLTDKLITSVRAQIFERFISQYLNQMEERPGRQVELSQDRKLLLLHMDAAEQEVIQKKTIDEAFQPYTYIFFVLPNKQQVTPFAAALRQCSNITGFKREKKSSPKVGLVWAVEQNYICVSYMSNQKPLEGIELSNHGLAKLMEIIPEESLNFKLAIKAELDQPEDEEWSNKFIFEKNNYHHITLIGPKSQMRSRYQELVRLLLMNQLSFEYLTRNRNRPVSGNDIRVQPSMDITKVDESSFVYSKIEDKSIIQQNQGSIIDPTILLPKDIVASSNFKFEGYNFNIFQLPGLKKVQFSTTILKVEALKIPFTFAEGEKLLAQATGGKYKFFKLKVPFAHQKDIQAELEKLLANNEDCRAFKEWVTVYVGAPAENLLKNEKINVGKVSKGSGVKDGYLVLTNLAFLYAEGGNELASHQYEPICYIRKMT